VLEDLIKRILILRISNNIDIIGKRQEQSFFLIFAITKNLYYEEYKADCKTLLGEVYHDFFSKKADVKIAYRDQPHLVNIVFEFRLK